MPLPPILIFAQYCWYCCGGSFSSIWFLFFLLSHYLKKNNLLFLNFFLNLILYVSLLLLHSVFFPPLFIYDVNFSFFLSSPYNYSLLLLLRLPQLSQKSFLFQLGHTNFSFLIIVLITLHFLLILAHLLLIMWLWVLVYFLGCLVFFWQHLHNSI